MPALSGVVIHAATDAEGARPRGVPGKRSTTVRRTIHDAAILSDVVAGFFGESEEKHGETLPLMEEAKFDRAFVFACSLRGKTHAHRTAEERSNGTCTQRTARGRCEVGLGRVGRHDGIVEDGPVVDGNHSFEGVRARQNWSGVNRLKRINVRYDFQCIILICICET